MNSEELSSPDKPGRKVNRVPPSASKQSVILLKEQIQTMGRENEEKQRQAQASSEKLNELIRLHQ